MQWRVRCNFKMAALAESSSALKQAAQTTEGNECDKPRVLVLGGCGMIGRNLVEYLVANKLCSLVRVADKAMPVVSFFSDVHKEVFHNDIVEYVQADLCKQKHRERAFKIKDGKGGPFDIVINCAAETKFSQADSVYEQRCLALSVSCAKGKSPKSRATRSCGSISKDYFHADPYCLNTF